MRINDHSQFILTPISSILKESVLACESIGKGMETQSLSEYVFQTLFLKMTGASEQKLKCICWDLASNDFEYRYQYLKNNYGECSNYTEKNKVYQDLISQIKKIDSDFDLSALFSSLDMCAVVRANIDEMINDQVRGVEEKQRKKGLIFNDEYRTKMITSLRIKYINGDLKKEKKDQLIRNAYVEQCIKCVLEIMEGSILKYWDERSFLFFVSNWDKVFKKDFAYDTLLGKDMENDYFTIVYQHRNRCAHNIMSYQANLPTLKTLASEDYKFENYFFRFAFLVLLDTIFIDLYRIYLNLLDCTIS